MKIDEIKIHVGKEKGREADPREGFSDRIMYEEGKIVVRRGEDIKEYHLRIGAAAYIVWEGRFLEKGTSQEPGPVLELLAQCGPRTSDEIYAFSRDVGIDAQYLDTIGNVWYLDPSDKISYGEHYRLQNIGSRIERTFTKDTKVTIE